MATRATALCNAARNVGTSAAIRETPGSAQIRHFATANALSAVHRAKENPSGNIGLTTRSSGLPMSVGARIVTSARQPLSSSVSTQRASMARYRFLQIIFVGTLWSSTGFALDGPLFQVTLEPSAPQVGAELFVRFSNIPGACGFPISPLFNTQSAGSDLHTFVDLVDYEYCPSLPDSERFSLGLLPSGVTSVSIFVCGFSPPGVTTCDSLPTWQFSFQPQPSIFTPVPALSSIGATLLSVLLLGIGACCRYRPAAGRAGGC